MLTNISDLRFAIEQELCKSAGPLVQRVVEVEDKKYQLWRDGRAIVSWSDEIVDENNETITETKVEAIFEMTVVLRDIQVGV
jgi:hypothetical protein